jgi:Flp pilus assembly pilin Flp
MRQTWQELWKDESGQDLAEYALLLSFVSIIVLVALRLLGISISEVWRELSNTLSNAA